MGGNYLNFAIRRDEIGRYGLTVGDVQDVIQSAIGGMNITTTVEGLERYPVNLRYSRDLRDNPAELRDILVQTPTRQQIPLGLLTDMSFVKGPPVIKSEQARPNAWVYVDIQDVDVGTYVERATQAVAAGVDIPAGYSLGWSGQYEYMVRAQERLRVVVPLTVLLIVLIVYASTQSAARTLIVLTAVPLSLAGAFWLLDALQYNLSIAVWVGIVALGGLSAETGMVMLPVPGPRLRRGTRRGTPGHACRAASGRVRRRLAAGPAGGHAERDDRARPAPDHVERRHRRRRDEADRGADGGRRGDDRARRAAGVPGHLLHLARLGVAAARLTPSDPASG